MIFNVGQTQARLEMVEQAIASFERYLAFVPD